MRGKSYTSEEEQFLRERLEEDWRAAEGALKRHEVALRAKEAGLFLGKSILACALLVGIVTVAAVAPNAFGVIGKAFLRKRYFGKKEFETQLHSLEKGGYVKAEKTKHGYRVTLTNRGHKRALLEAERQLKVRSSLAWDGTWWVAMFDIPRKHNAARNALRTRFRAIGMEQLQASVFASK